MNENNMNQGFPENPNGADGGMNDQTPENNMPYGYNADPNMGAYNNMNGYNADPNMGAYNNMNGYNADPNTGAYNNMNGYNADPNMGYAQPGMNEFGDQTPYQATVPKKKKGGKIALFTFIGVVLVAAIVTAVYFFVRKTPAEAIKAAMKNTVTESVDSSPLEDVIGVSEFSEDKMDFDMNLKVNSIYKMDGLSGSTYGISGAFEKQKDNSYNLNLNGSLTIAGETVNANLYGIDKVFYFEIPELYDSVFKMDLAAMLKSLDTSDMDEATQNEVKALYEKYMEPATEDLKKAVTYDRVGSAEIENHNGDKEKCKQYTVTLPTADVKAYVTALCNYLNAYASDYITDDQLDEIGVTRAELSQAFQYIPTYYGMMFSKDFVVNIYVKKNQLARISMDYKFTALGGTASVVWDYMGEEHPADDVYFCASVKKDEKELGSVSFSKKKENTKGSYVYKLTDSVVVNDKAVAGLEQTATFTKSTNAFESHLTLTANDEAVFAYDLTGSLKDVRKGKSFGATVDSFKVTDGGDTVYADLSGDVQFGDLGKEIGKPDESKQVVDYTEMTDEYMESNINQEAAQRIVSAWSSALGSAVDNGDIDIDDFITSDATTDDGDNDDEYVIDSSSIDDVDYSGYVMKGEGYTVALNDPAGYDRGYADNEEIDIYNDKYNAYYTLTPNCDKEKECENFMTYFDYLGEDGSVLDKKMEQVTGTDGKTMDCYVIDSDIYDIKVRDYYYFYPINDKDYIVVNVNVWANGKDQEVDADITAIANELVNDQIINVQEQ